MTSASAARVKRFIDCFIRSEYVSYFISEEDMSWNSSLERANRVADAVELGCDGHTHAEYIDSWRRAFADYVQFGAGRGGRCNRNVGYPRFEAAVQAYFNEVEAWHEKAGDLWSEIG